MSTSQPTLFAHRGGSVGRENSIAASRRAVAAGATGLETDVWATRDEVLILNHDETLLVGGLPHAISETRYSELPKSIDTLRDLLQQTPNTTQMSLDVFDMETVSSCLQLISEIQFPLENMWFCHREVSELSLWVEASPEVNAVNSLVSLTERHSDSHLDLLREARISAINLPISEWSEKLVAATHSRGLLAFAWNCHTELSLRFARSLQLDAVYSDDVTGMCQVYERRQRSIG